MDEIILTKEDNDSSLIVNRGDTLRIILQENPTTGYTWQVDGELPPQLKEVSSEQKKTYKGSLGGAGKRILDFSIEATGKAKLSLKYWQPRSGEASVSERFCVSLEIEK